MPQVTVEKVTALITRRVANAACELLVFRHANPLAGIQLPAGTVEPGETLLDAVLREAHEETGLAALVPVGPPERAPLELDDDQVYLHAHRELAKTLGVEIASPLARLVSRDDDEARVVARRLDGSPLELRLASTHVTRDVRRWLFHLRLTGEAPDRFQRAFDTAQPWSFYWVPVEADPGLRHRHRDWLQQMRPRLLARG